jgi:hypothetical protein
VAEEDDNKQPRGEGSPPANLLPFPLSSKKHCHSER